MDPITHRPAHGSATDLNSITQPVLKRMALDAKAALEGDEDALDRAAKWATIALVARKGAGYA